MSHGVESIPHIERSPEAGLDVDGLTRAALDLARAVGLPAATGVLLGDDSAWAG